MNDSIHALMKAGLIKRGTEIQSPNKVHKEISPELQELLCSNYSNALASNDNPYAPVEYAVMDPELFGPSDLMHFCNKSGNRLTRQQMRQRFYNYTNSKKGK